MRRFIETIQNQRGFTLVEVLIAVVILGFISSSVTAVIFQITTVQARDTTHMSAVKEVENAVYWLSNDAQMAQRVNVAASNSSHRFIDQPLILTWEEWGIASGQHIAHSVTYSVQNGGLVRTNSVTGQTTTTVVVVPHLNSASNFTFPLKAGSSTLPSGDLVFQITSGIGGFKPASETRSFSVMLRTMQ